MSELILYTTEDGQSRIQLRADNDTVWLSQLEMAELFNASKQNISLHLRNIYADGELDPQATVKESLTVQKIEEAIAADEAVETELKALEDRIKQRPQEQ